MTLTAEDLDPDVAAALTRRTRRRRSRRIGSEAVGVLGIAALGLGLFVLGHSTELQTVGEGLLGASLILLLVVVFQYLHRSRRVSADRDVYDAETLSRRLSRVRLSPVEQDYTGVLLALLADQSPAREESRRGTLRVVNGLMQDYRALKGERKRLESTLRTERADLMREDARRLSREIKKASDPEVAETKRQTLRMVERRIADTEAGNRMVERLEAQEEAVAQTLATLRVGLLRLASTPAAPQVTNSELESLVADVTRQTRSVEQAVQEVQAVLMTQSSRP